MTSTEMLKSGANNCDGSCVSYCKKCYMREYYKKNRTDLLQAMQNYSAVYSVRRRELNTKRIRANRERTMCNAARFRAKERGIPFDIEASDIFIPPVCPLIGIPLIHSEGAGSSGPNSPSLDRINPERGYVKGNVWVISKRANVMKNDATLEELEMLVANLRKKVESK